MKTQIPMVHRTYVVASEDENGPWSLAYVSQVYGTIFGIYTNLKLSNHGGKKICQSIDFKLGNFKGLVMLGMSKVSARKKIDPETQSPVLILDVHVKGLETKREIGLDISRLDMEIHEGTKIKVQRHLDPLHDSQAEFGGIFDTEHYYRDAPNTNPVEFAQHASAFYAYKNGHPSEIRANSLSEFSPYCVESIRFVKIE